MVMQTPNPINRIIPIVMDVTGKPNAALGDATNLVYSDQVVTRTKGYETLEFDIPLFSSKRFAILPERILQFDNRFFRIKLIEDSHNSNNLTHVTCYALWYDLMNGADFSKQYTSTIGLAGVLNDLVAGTEWRVARTPNVGAKNGATFPPNSRLWALRLACKIFGVSPTFDTKYKTIEIVLTNNTVKYPGVFHADKNISSLKRTIDSRNLCTRYTVIGKDDATMAPANGGLPYRENYSWFDSQQLPRRIIPITQSDDRFVIPGSMVETADEYLSLWSSPVISYEVDAVVLDGLPELYQKRLVIDPEMGVNDWLSCSERVINYSDYTKSKVTFSDPRADLVDLLNEEEI